MVLLAFSTKNHKDRHEKFYISRKNKDIYNILDKIKVDSDYSDKICQYIRMGFNIEKGLKNKTITDNEIASKFEESQKPAIPRLNEYHAHGIQGKTVGEAVERRIISHKEATDIIISAKEILVEAENTGQMWRYLPKIVKSKRDLKKPGKVQRLINKVKECIEEAIPVFNSQDDEEEYVNRNKEFEDMMNSNDYEIVPDGPGYRYNYNLPYNPPNPNK